MRVIIYIYYTDPLNLLQAYNSAAAVATEATTLSVPYSYPRNELMFCQSLNEINTFQVAS